jgi:hypothetical protein
MAKTPKTTAKQASRKAPAVAIPKEIISYRLTNFDRDEIRNRALKASFDPRKAILDEAEDRLAREAYAVVFPAQLRKQVAALPEKWVQRDRCLRFNVGGMDARLEVLEPNGLPVPFCNYCSPLGSIADEILIAAIRSHMDTKETFKKDRVRASSSLHAMLSAITTLRSLADAWPDGYPFFSYLNKPSPTRLPALCVSELNAMLGLPQMQEAA